jgi:hypothetical protein
MTGCGEEAMAIIGAKGGSFPLIGAIWKAKDLTMMTKVHNGVCIVARCAVELRRACGYDKTRQGGDFLAN